MWGWGRLRGQQRGASSTPCGRVATEWAFVAAFAVQGATSMRMGGMHVRWWRYLLAEGAAAAVAGTAWLVLLVLLVLWLVLVLHTKECVRVVRRRRRWRKRLHRPAP